MHPALVYYYGLLIGIGVSLIVIVWLLITLRNLQRTSEEKLLSSITVSEKMLKLLGLDKPDLKPPAPKITAERPGGATEAPPIQERLNHIENTYGRLKKLLDLKLFLHETKIEEVMNKKVVSLSVQADFKEVPEKFSQHAIRHLPIVDAAQKIVGLMTQRDLYRICSPRKLVNETYYYDDEVLNTFILNKVMNKKVVTMRLDKPLGDAVVTMASSGYGCLPIVDAAGRLCGIITRRDVLALASLVYLSQPYATTGDSH